MEKIIQNILEKDWAMDSLAAETLSRDLSKSEQNTVIAAVGDINENMRENRDINRLKLNNLFDSIGFGAILGSCSLDRDVEYGPVFDFILEQQEKHTDSTLIFRGNGSKPRTSTGWRGSWASTIEQERSVIKETYLKAMKRGIPIITEITDSPQLGELAPYLSGQWIGARDMASTSLRFAMAGIHLAAAVKNGLVDESKNLEAAIKVIKSNTIDNDGAGFNLGSIASTNKSRGVATGILPIGQGNKHVAIFARGYPLPENMSSAERKTKALEHLSKMCTLAEMQNCAVLIDATHSVAPMFAFEQTDPMRFVKVLREINNAIEKDQIENSHRIRGIIGEAGPVKGRTDPNFILDNEGKKILSDLLEETFEVIKN